MAGLNPHAGEHGILGEEDERFIRPAVAQARSRGIDADGPLSADTLFPRAAAGGSDLAVAMYHDQGHIPVKLLGRGEGVAVTLGLPFLRMSPDHGAAFDIAGQGVARPGSMTAALRAAAAARPPPWSSAVTARRAQRGSRIIPGGTRRLPPGPGRGHRQLPGGPVHPGRAAGRLVPARVVAPARRGIPGSQSFDLAANWALICACIREVLGAAPSPAAVRAVGCSSMGGGLVLYGRGGQELWACANGDARAEREAAVMLADGTAAELYRRGRLALAERRAPAGLGAPPRARGWAAAARLSMIADWIVFRLTGTLATEASIGSTSGLFDLGRRAWSPELLALCGLEAVVFPEVVEAGTVVGQVSAAASRQTGLPPARRSWRAGWTPPSAWPARGQRYPAGLTVTGGSFWKQTVRRIRARRGAGRPAAHDLPCPAGPVAGGGDRLLRRVRAALAPGPRRRAGQRAARRVTPGWRNWPRRYRPGLAGSPPGWSRPTPGPGRAGSRRSRQAGKGGAGRTGRRAGAGHPRGRRLLHPPGRRAGQRAARSRRMAGGDPDRRGSPQQAVAADPRRRARM